MSSVYDFNNEYISDAKCKTRYTYKRLDEHTLIHFII